MLSRSLAALNRRRNDPDSTDKGFTLIELLVVVIIIGILAAIAVPVYLGVQASAKDSGVKSDLTNAKIAVIAYQTDIAAYPADADFTVIKLGKYGYTQSYSTAVKYSGTAPSATAPAFCLVLPSETDSTKSFYVTDTTGVSKTAVVAADKPTGC